MSSFFLSLPLLAIAAHLVEEFVWPGGFARWYRSYPPGSTVVVTTRLLVIVNVVFVALAVLPLVLRAPALALGYWLVVAAIAGANGLFHLRATLQTRTYSPGVVTGVILYIPLALVGGAHLLRAGLVAPATAIQTVAIAAAYSWWSAWQHRRHIIGARTTDNAQTELPTSTR
jgi:hypothetical protein